MIYSYKFASASAVALSAALGIKRIKTEGSKFKGNENKIVINWGASSLPEEVKNCTVINSEEAVSIAADKLKFFEAVEGKVQVPEFTTDVKVAREWAVEGKIVVARTKLNGHSGEGIYILEDLGSFDSHYHGDFKLYVKYIPKKEEYRIHVVDGVVIDSRRKALSNDFIKEHVNWKIRSHQNGFIFAKDGFDVPEEVLEQSILAVSAIGLDFGAVDVIWNNFYKKAYVLEVNTAPGLEGSSVDNYKEAFEKLYEAGPAYVKKKKAPFINPEWFDQGIAVQAYQIKVKNLGKAAKVAEPVEVDVAEDKIEAEMKAYFQLVNKLQGVHNDEF